MCGIVGYLGQDEAAPVLMEALRRLEYRGYDSAGIACLGSGQIIGNSCINGNSKIRVDG